MFMYKSGLETGKERVVKDKDRGRVGAGVTPPTPHKDQEFKIQKVKSRTQENKKVWCWD